MQTLGESGLNDLLKICQGPFPLMALCGFIHGLSTLSCSFASTSLEGWCYFGGFGSPIFSFENPLRIVAPSLGGLLLGFQYDISDNMTEERQTKGIVAPSGLVQSLIHNSPDFQKAMYSSKK